MGVGLGVVAALTALRSALGTTALLVLVVGDGDGVPLVDVLGVAVPEAVGDGEALGTGVADPAPLTRTWRKRSSAVCWTVARMFLSCLPGIEMTMLLPAVVTSDSATPKLSTRLRMMETAWFSESFGTDPEPLVEPRREDDAGAALEVQTEPRLVLLGQGQRRACRSSPGPRRRWRRRSGR